MEILLSGQLFLVTPQPTRVTDMITMARQLGYNGLELMLPAHVSLGGSPYTVSDYMAKELPDSSDYGFIKVVHAPNGVFGLENFSYCLHQGIELAHKVGAKLVNIHPPSRKYSDKVSRQGMYQTVQHLRERTGITVAVELLGRPTHAKQHQQRSHANADSWLRDMVRRRVPVTLDTTHLASWGMRSKADHLLWANVFGKQLVHVHLSDFIPNPHTEHVIIGHGQLDFKGFLRFLRHTRPKITITVELSKRYGREEQAANAARLSMENIRSLLS